jgi:DNA polymerase-3 subunit beta
MKQMEGKIKDEKKMIVPRKAVSELRRFLSKEEEVKISIGKNHLLFSVAGVQFLTRLIEGTYPNYEHVIPQSNEKKISIKREAFTRALRRVSVMSRERANAVRADFGDNNLTISSSNPDLGEAREEVAIDYKGDKLSVGFNARYLIDALGVIISENVVLELQDPLSPVLLREEGGEDYKCVVMPMRI